MSASRIIPPEELAAITHQKPVNLHKLTHAEIDVQKELQKRVEGEVRFDSGSKAMYAVDASNYRQVPIGVVIPRSKEDVVNTIAVCREYGLPVLSRGGGTSLAGECCNAAIVIDWSKYMRGVLELNLSERWARVLPGTICDELRDEAMKQSHSKLVWGPDPATHNHCCFGGMIGNNSCGAHAQMSGKTDNNVEELEILLYDGTRMTVGWMTDAEMEDRIRMDRGREGKIYAALRSLRDRYSRQIQEKYPHIPRRVSGYNLDQLIPGKDGRFNVARALVGSESTLVTVLEAKCRLIDARAERVIVVLGYPDVYQAADAVPEILPYNPTALEGLDRRLHDNIKIKGSRHAKYLPLLPEGGGWLMVELGSDNKSESLDQAHELVEKLKKQKNPPHIKLLSDKKEMEHLWAVRESGLGATAFVPGQPDAWPGWEDSAVPPEKMGNYLRDVCKLYEKYNYTAALYGHFGQGCLHCRVSFDLTSEPGIQKWRNFMEEATDLCVSYGGSLSGEHGDGQARGEFLYKMFGHELIDAFREFKSIWDPDWKMNPGKVIDAYKIDQNLRLGADYDPWQPQTHFQYPEDGGKFSHAALRCVGIGKCRRTKGKNDEDDVMCPSYMVTHEERHTTRGRAHHLWEMLNGDVISNGWRDDRVKESLDLCLACKGCKGDCPVNVDMATYKAEFLSHYWEGRLRPRYAYAFGLIDQWSRIATRIPGLVNLATQTPGLKQIAKLAAGMPSERKIPEFAPQNFQQWFQKHDSKVPKVKGKVILWPDTFNNYFFPHTARAAVAVLEDAGYQVEVPKGHVCCGRPLYDYGMLDLAKTYLKRTFAKLEPGLNNGTPIVVLEPSCASVFADEAVNLFPDDPIAQKLKKHTMLLSDFLDRGAKDYQYPKLKAKALVQGHCHHKSILDFDDEKKALEKIGLNYEIPKTGCCGMAGSFGFEKEKYPVSIAVGEHGLLPKVRKAETDTVIIADGFSCREQISQATNRHGLHLAEVLYLAKGERRKMGELPESRFYDRRKAELRKSKIKTLATLAGIAAGAVLTAKLWKR